MEKDYINLISELLENPKKIVILTHQNPDGDAIGSSLGLYVVLRKMKHQVDVITPNDFPEFLKWMPYANQIIIGNRKTKTAKMLISNAEIIFCLDFNAPQRIAELQEDLEKSTAIKILIDHHLQPDDFCNYSISNVMASSTSEMVFDFICNINQKLSLNKEIAECLYVGIITDTGSYSYSCNNSNLYSITAELFNFGIDGENIHRKVYDTYTEERIRMLGYCLSDGLFVHHSKSIAYIKLSQEKLNFFKHQIGDTEGFVNYPLSIESVQISALLIEKEGHVRISLRAKGMYDVNEISRMYFNGGGHKNAAGGKIFKPFEEAIAYFEECMDKIIKNFN